MLLNNALRKVSESTIGIGMSDASFVETRTFDGHIFLINCTGTQYEDKLLKVNVFSIFRDNGNIGLAKIIMEKTSQGISKKISKL